MLFRKYHMNCPREPTEDQHECLASYDLGCSFSFPLSKKYIVRDGIGACHKKTRDRNTTERLTVVETPLVLMKTKIPH